MYNGYIRGREVFRLRKPVRYKTFDQISFTDLLVYSKLPSHPFWSVVAEKVDFTFADSLCAFLYSGRGQHPYAPSLKLKIHLVQGYYALSDRLAEEKIIGDLFIKRFLELPVEFFGFDHSTIALDRHRMGLGLFRACHLYILAQMYSLGLWGDQDESWILDSFPCNPGLAMVGTHRLIQQAALRVLQHLKRSHSGLYQMTQKSLLLSALTARSSLQSPKHEQLLAFSKLASEAHALLEWFDTPQVVEEFSQWTNTAARQKSFELQDILRQVLSENCRPSGPEGGSSVPLEAASPDADSHSDGTTGDSTEAIVYEKIPRANRSSNRIISAVDPNARIGMKTSRKRIKGYKTQNLCTSSGAILDVRVIPACEHDREATFDMVHNALTFWNIRPCALLADTSYGHGRQRTLLKSIGVEIVAPVPPAVNPTGLYPNSRFEYDPQNDVYRCPNGNTSSRKNHNSKLEGTQYYFGKVCKECPLREECTPNRSGRSVFRSDYADVYERAHAFNTSIEGRALLQQRSQVERKNAEVKNDCGVGASKTRSQNALDIKAVMAAITVNLKLLVWRLGGKPGFVRRCRLA